jgi:hypothetical protein
LLTEDEIFASLDRTLQNGVAPITTSMPTRPVSDRLEIEAQAVTLATFNLFDNGPDVRVTWAKARYVTNVQLFDLTEPFTPGGDLAVWDLSIQMHTIEFFSRYLDGRHPEQSQAYREIIQDTFSKADVYPDLLIGQPYSKRHGTSYAWGTILRTWTDDLGEFAAELLINGTSIRDQGFAPPPPRRNTVTANRPVMIGKYDPRGLWRVKNPKFARTPS